MQEDVGLQSATDGEFRRTSWHMDFIYQLDGIDPADEQIKVEFHNEQGDVEFTTAALSVHDRVGLSTTIFGDAFEALRSMTTTTTPKLTIPSPSMVHYRGGQAAIDKDVYPESTSSGDDLVSRVPRGGAAARRARLHVSPVRRHEPRLHERPEAARVHREHRRRPGTPARGLHPPHQRSTRRPAAPG